MSDFDRAVKALNDVDEAIDHLADNEAYVTALEAAGLLVPDAQIIRTLEELEKQDPEALTVDRFGITGLVQEWLDEHSRPYPESAQFLPVCVVDVGAQVRDAAPKMIEALEGEERDNEQLR